MSTTVRIGTEFRHHFADSNPLWRVTKRVRTGVYDAVGVNEPLEVNGRMFDSDFAGQTRRFTAEIIVAAVRHGEFMKGLFTGHDDFWANVPAGKVLHYHHSFGAYVRGVVVVHQGKRCFSPTALVGNWSPCDLPRRSPTGEVGYSTGGRYFAADHKPWQPSESCVFETPGFKDRGADPRRMDPIDLTVPEPTPERAEEERLYRLRAAVIGTLSDRADVASQLEAAALLLKTRKETA